MISYVISFSVKDASVLESESLVRYFCGFSVASGLSYASDVMRSYWFASKDDAVLFLSLLRLSPMYLDNECILGSKVSTLSIDIK